MPPTVVGHVDASTNSNGQQIVADREESITLREKDERQKIDKASIDYVLRSGLAGGLAGCASAYIDDTSMQAKTIVGPLDRVKILFQASNPQFAKYTGSWFGVVTAMKDIYHQDGVWGLFRGHSATLLRIFPYAGIKFLAYEQIRAAMIKGPEQETPWRRLVSGSLAGVTTVFFTYPLEVIRVRLAFETKKDVRPSLSGICRQIYNAAAPTPASKGAGVIAESVRQVTNHSGLVNFYRGFSPTLWGMLPYAGVSFLTHDTAGDWLRHPSIARWTVSTRLSNAPPGKPSPLNTWAQLVAGGFAGLVSQTVSYPLEVIRRRMQVGGTVGDGHRLGISETTKKIWSERGVKGFFVGLTIGYVKVVPMVATSFFVYERSKTWLGI
ncbi:MAG: hypothetical protein M1824_004740 [Vezdaea acicularis]|nr:MAG: hypothetical protein M1824_004740 [Vezdaea acicularis]